MPERVDEVTLLTMKTASVALTELVVYEAPLTVNSVDVVVPVSPVPVTVTRQALSAVE